MNPDEEYENQLENQRQINEDLKEDDYFTQMPQAPVQQEPEVSDKIITVQSAFNKRGQLKPHKELFTTDVVTAFGTEGDRSVFDQNANLLSHVVALEEKYEWDLSDFFNMVVRTTHGVTISSKMTGKAAKVAKSMYAETSSILKKEINHPQKKGFKLPF
jgi:hypothetical protein